jgi:hypothetical protein
MINECGAVDGIKIGRGNRSTMRKLPQCHFVQLAAGGYAAETRS